MMSAGAGYSVWDHEVQCREDEDPHKVNKVPIKTKCFNLARMLVPTFCVGPKEHVRHGNHATNHVQSMEARHEEVE